MAQSQTVSFPDDLYQQLQADCRAVLGRGFSAYVCELIKVGRKSLELEGGSVHENVESQNNESDISGQDEKGAA